MSRPTKFKKQGFGVMIRMVRYVLELLRSTGGIAYGKKKEPQSGCKENTENEKYIDSEQEIQGYGIPDAVFGP